MLTIILKALGLSSSFLIPSYLIFKASSKSFFKDYAVLYSYLTALMLTDGMRWIALSVFGRDSYIFYFIYHIPTFPLIMFKFFLICWLFWIIFSNDYPSIRFGFVMIFLVTTFVFLLFLAGSQGPYHSPLPLSSAMHHSSQYQHVNLQQLRYVNEQLAYLNRRAEYFNMASLLLITVLSVIIFVFKLPIGDNLKGILLGLNANLILGRAFDGLKLLFNDPDELKIIRSFYFVPLLVMLLIFCRYLSSKKVSESLCINERLKLYDGKVSEFLVKTRLYNTFTNRYFFKYFLFEGNSAGQRAFFENYRKRLKSTQENKVIIVTSNQVGSPIHNPRFMASKANDLLKSSNRSMSVGSNAEVSID